MAKLEETPNKTEWMKVPAETMLQYAGKEAVCIGKGNHLIFYNLSNSQEHIYTANSLDKGDGISCYAGHRNVPVVGFAEKVLNPRILIMLYPDLVPIKIIKDGAPEGYKSMFFSEQTYLIALTSEPRHELQIWNWRNTEKLCSFKTSYHYNDQIVRCSLKAPITIVQYGICTNNFILWDIYNSYKKCISIKHHITLPSKEHITKCMWSTDDIFYCQNTTGSIFTLRTDYTAEVVIYGGTTMGTCVPTFVAHKGGLLVFLTTMHIKYFKKTGNLWYEEWEIPPVNLNQLVLGRNYVVGWSVHGELLELDTNKHALIVRKNYMTSTEMFCLIHPQCNYFAAIMPQNEKNVVIFEAFTGDQVSNIEVIRGAVCALKGNPVYPYLTAGLNSGTLTLINCVDIANPCFLTRFRLNNQPITDIVFNDTGTIIVTANLELGLFFVIKGIPGTEMVILNYIEYRRRTLSVSVLEEEKFINVYILVQTDSCYPLSQRIVVQCISKSDPKKVKKKKYIIEKKKFTHLIVCKNFIVGRIFNSKYLSFLKLEKKTIKIEREIFSGHYLHIFKLMADMCHIYTVSYSGIIFVRSPDLEEIIYAILPHHRYSAGTKYAKIDPFNRYILSYGEGTQEFVCTRFTNTVEDSTGDHLFHRVKNVLLGAPTIGFDPPIEYDEDGKPLPRKTYLETLKALKINEEKKEFAKEREAIMNEFLVLQKEVVELLDRNLNGPELEKIDILEFYQHTLLRQHKEEINKKECEWTVLYCKDLIRAQDEITAYMKQQYYDTMSYKSSTIFGIYSNIICESYALTPEAAGYVALATRITMYREIENMIREGDHVQLWENMSRVKLMEKLEKPPIIQFKTETARIKEALDEVEDTSSTDLHISESGYPSNTVGDFIELSDLLYKQEEMLTPLHYRCQRRLIQYDQEKLRLLFNKKFEEVKAQKSKDFNVITEKNTRLRFILSELNVHNIEIEDPIIDPTEDPHDVVKVSDKEIGITPYISPSEQAKLDWEAAEAERIRLLLLADDFREKALIKMMDGVLEIRWEDTLKREIPKPKCMLEKAPETWNEEDLRLVRDYEEKVAFLHSERLRYKNMLETEYRKTGDFVREVFKKFNSRLSDLEMYKILIESARMQQIFEIQRMQMQFMVYFRFNNATAEIKDNIAKNEEFINELFEKLEELGNASATCRSVGETLHAKDKVIEKNFKREFQDSSIVIQEQSLKLFKKQPKLTVKGISYVVLLVELGNCCISGEKSPILNQDCLDFLKSLDSLDQYVGVPSTIDENMYKIICKHRRFRIDNELKIRANYLEQQDIEYAFISFQKYLATRKDHALTLHTNLADMRERKLVCIQDKTLQIVMRKGLVEIPMNGYLSDFDTAVLIQKQDVESINKKIRKEGEKKLVIMNEKMIHRREILIKEWEHRRMRMEIEDLKQHLFLVEKIKVTKEVQQYLRQRAKGESFDRGILTLDQEIEAQRKSYEKVLSERKNAIDELQKQINSYKKKNKALDNQIAEINIDICEYHESRDLEFEKKYGQMLKNRMLGVVKRSNLVKQIQDQHNEIMVLQTELELLRLKTYPTLKFKTL